MWFKQIKLTAHDEIYVGIDAHKDSCSVAIWLNDAPALDFVMPADNKRLARTLEKLRPALKQAVYEAGPTGYSLARELRKAKLPVHVVAPSKTPRQAGRDSKTDRLDCRKLAQYAAKRLLRPIAIPTRQQEADRQVSRLREQLVAKQKRIKYQIKSFLLQHGLRQPTGLKSWSHAAVQALQKMQLSTQLRFCLDTLLAELGFLEAQIKNTEQKLTEIFSHKHHAPRIKILKTHPGVGPVISGQFCVEIFDPDRFKSPTEVAKYVGLCPMVTQSGQSQRDGPILKTGSKDPHAYRVFRRILHNTGEKNKAITAMARRLAVNLWKMACDNEPYRKPLTN
jgi:transposase